MCPRYDGLWLLDYQRTKVNDVLNVKSVNDVLNVVNYLFKKPLFLFDFEMKRLTLSTKFSQISLTALLRFSKHRITKVGLCQNKGLVQIQPILSIPLRFKKITGGNILIDFTTSLALLAAVRSSITGLGARTTERLWKSPFPQKRGSSGGCPVEYF